VYSILEGTGTITLDDQIHPLAPGTVVLIPAGTRHQVTSPGGLKTIVVAMPPFQEADEHFD
jgi:mannose-6-phosphate isomerase-like protein (cupin superfamily)